jgi:hypothetical protein
MSVALGIDLGLTGALALLSDDGIPELVADLPVICDRSLKWIDGAALQSLLLDALRGRQCRAVADGVLAIPRQGVALGRSPSPGNCNVQAIERQE